MGKQERTDDGAWSTSVDWSFCERCHKRFVVRNSSSGRFCSRRCYAPGSKRVYVKRPPRVSVNRSHNATWPELVAALIK